MPSRSDTSVCTSRRPNPSTSTSRGSGSSSCRGRQDLGLAFTRDGRGLSVGGRRVVGGRDRLYLVSDAGEIAEADRIPFDQVWAYLDELFWSPVPEDFLARLAETYHDEKLKAFLGTAAR
jgi:hypothetical protein